MQPELILQPFAAMMLLTLLVWLRLYFTRIPEITRQRINPQKLATRAQKSKIHLSDAEACTSDNFQNLFELPVIFYAVCLALFALGTVDALYVALAWLFVALRAAHSLIHLTYNKVLHRFVIYVAGGAALAAMVLRLAWQVMIG